MAMVLRKFQATCGGKEVLIRAENQKKAWGMALTWAATNRLNPQLLELVEVA